MCEQCVAKVHTLGHHSANLMSLALYTMLAMEWNREDTNDLINDVIDLQMETMKKLSQVYENQLLALDVDPEESKPEWHPTPHQRKVVKHMLSEFTGISLMDLEDWETAIQSHQLAEQIGSLMENMHLEMTSVEEALGGHDPDTMH